jgi:glucose-1-phosphate cytidylyltransferase
MKVVILAGGFGTRISEESHFRPKPMIEIGGRPILWHIMKIYGAHGFTDFVICLGYRGYLIKEYFANYLLHESDVTVDLVEKRIELHQHDAEPWRVTLVDTGHDTMTGGRLLRVRRLLEDSDFCFTYGDGVSDVDVTKLVDSHRKSKALATLTAVQPAGRFGALSIEQDRVRSFQEKPAGDGSWVNAGFFVLSPAVFDYLENDATVWERAPLERLAREGRLAAHRHSGFWQPMDTLRDKNLLEELWTQGRAPWKVWT